MSLPDPLPPSNSARDARHTDEPSPTDPWMDARVEAYVDGTLPPGEEAAFEAHLQATPRWQSAVRRARRVRAGLQSLDAPACPPSVTQAVLRQACPSSEASSPPDRPPQQRRVGRPADTKPQAWKPALALAALLALAATGALLGQPHSSPAGEASPSFTQTEVQRATAEAQWTLAFLAQVTRETGHTVRKDVLRDRVARPTQEAALRAFRHVPSDSSLLTSPASESQWSSENP